MPRLRNMATGVVVNVGDARAQTLGGPYKLLEVSPPADEPAPAPPKAGTEGTSCPDCEFVAKSAAGLTAHRRSHTGAA